MTYAVKLGIKITHSESAESNIYFPTGEYPMVGRDDQAQVIWEAESASVLDADGGTNAADKIAKTFSGDWTVWFLLPQGLVFDSFGGTIIQNLINEGFVSWLYVYVEWSDTSVTQVGSLGPGGYSWDGQFPLGWMMLEEPITTIPDVVAELWQNKINTIEVNS